VRFEHYYHFLLACLFVCVTGLEPKWSAGTKAFQPIVPTQVQSETRTANARGQPPQQKQRLGQAQHNGLVHQSYKQTDTSSRLKHEPGTVPCTSLSPTRSKTKQRSPHEPPQKPTSRVRTSLPRLKSPFGRDSKPQETLRRQTPEVTLAQH
jgi:hypothetical protein